MTSGESPLSLFDVAGKVAIVTGASGSFGALAAATLAAAGAKLVLSAGKAKELAEVAAACRARGAEVEEAPFRPSEQIEPARRSSKRRSTVSDASTSFTSSPPAKTMSQESSTWRRSAFST